MYEEVVISILHFHTQRMKKDKRPKRLKNHYSADIDVLNVRVTLTSHNLFKYSNEILFTQNSKKTT